jgi:hypothetical protein
MDPSTPPKRRRGRPLGSGVKDDRATLRSVAEQITANPALKPWTAIKRACKSDDASHLHRINRKWKRNVSTIVRQPVW